MVVGVGIDEEIADIGHNRRFKLGNNPTTCPPPGPFPTDFKFRAKCHSGLHVVVVDSRRHVNGI